MEFSVYGNKYAKLLATNFSPFFHLHCYRQVASIFTSILDDSVKLLLLKCLRSMETKKGICDNCGTQTAKRNLARHKKRCSGGTLHCTQCPNFSTKSQNDMNYHTAKKHNAPKPDVTFKCKLCCQEFPGFYALRQRRNT